MVLNIKEKERIICEIQKNLKSALSVVVASFNGATVNFINQLRKEARDLKINVKVFPNSLLNRAFKNTSYESFLNIFVGQNIIAFSSEKTGDVVRIFTKFSKNNNYVKITGVIFENNILNLDQIDLLSNLPNHEESILKLVSILKLLCIGNFINILRSLSDKKLNYH